MDRRARVELFDELRRKRTYGVGTAGGVARKFHVHRRVVTIQVVSSAFATTQRASTLCVV